MTPPISIGDEVIITGPTITGCNCSMGEKFRVSLKCGDAYSGGGFPWYPASSLRLMPKFKTGDKVIVIGPAINGATGHKLGRVFEITQMPDECGILGPTHGVDCYSSEDVPMYPASSLRLVEELQIGDLVKIVGPDWRDCNDEIGETFDIESFNEEFKWYSALGMNFYPASSLRKLTPEEIQQYQTAQMLPKPTEIQELRRRIHDLEMWFNGFTNGPEPEYVSGISYVKDPIRKRLSAIESRLKEDRNLMTEIEERMDERQDVTDCALKTMGQSIGSLWEAIHKQNSEMPLPLVGFAVSMCGPVPACITSAIRRESEEAEKRKLEGDCKPNDEFHVIICKGGNEYANHYFRCPNDAIDWTKKVLDSMWEA
jgi:hypothetical protein